MDPAQEQTIQYQDQSQYMDSPITVQEMCIHFDNASNETNKTLTNNNNNNNKAPRLKRELPFGGCTDIKTIRSQYQKKMCQNNNVIVNDHSKKNQNIKNTNFNNNNNSNETSHTNNTNNNNDITNHIQSSKKSEEPLQDLLYYNSRPRRVLPQININQKRNKEGYVKELLN